MTLTLSFRAEENLARALDREADRMGVSRTEILNQALYAYLYRLACERDAALYDAHPQDPGETPLIENQYVLPAEEWTNL